ncbi:MAG: tRNA (adenosine(37)-N6)-threonylcarbamoyltransferase complex dimerization subunit type 1 TsaB [Thermoleophilia bacterium]
MPTFALDTSTASPSLALVRGDDTLAELWLAPEPGSGRRVLEAAHGLLRAAGHDVQDIGEVVVGVGPGGFTGLRIGLATALGLGQALAVPVTGASSLEGIALGLGEGEDAGTVVAPVLDARRRELFAAAYRLRADGGLDEVIAPLAAPPAEFAAALRALGDPVVTGGEGLAAAGEHLAGFRSPPPGSARHRASAAGLVRRVRAGAGVPARPVYARLPDAEVNRRAALAPADA